ncbi:ROK family protein [Horticoccus luteus]|uniref:ROK family protein n=1 Tax=Horticoccus luteus TaxID=2862869 RepID=A0A8F9TY35_9BACT|nr:ROK family protein [Horticoccus luteus]QYM79667.1 ROK family protein [Horticoccus luteus]
MNDIIGVDIGGTKCALSVPVGDGRVEEVARFATTDVRATLERIYAEIAKLAPTRDAVFGVSCGGPLDAKRGLILSPPNLPGWDRIAICMELTQRFGGRAFLMNDANACALAEWQFGAGRGCQSMMFLTMGTGMGAGLILDGRLYEGVTGNAGEVGHLRMAPDGPVGYGKTGSFEGFCSGGGIAQLARERVRTWAGQSQLQTLPREEITARAVGLAAEAGDALALAIWRDVGTRLGEALAWFIDLLNPERIVIGSIYARCEKFLVPAMNEVIVREALPDSARDCRVVPAELGDEIGSYAAVAIARYHGARTS